MDMSKEARSARYKEYLSLKQLPFVNEEQLKRLKVLSKQRVKDNRFAMRENRKTTRNNISTFQASLLKEVAENIDIKLFKKQRDDLDTVIRHVDETSAPISWYEALAGIEALLDSIYDIIDPV